jgi:hypothetical protein
MNDKLIRMGKTKIFTAWANSGCIFPSTVPTEISNKATAAQEHDRTIRGEQRDTMLRGLVKFIVEIW